MGRRAQFSRFGGPEVIEIVDVSPQSPSARQYRVKVHSVGLNRADHKTFRGVGRGVGESLPAGLGIDFSGVVDAVGEAPGAFAPGDAVLGSKRGHALADHVILDEFDVVVRKPQSLDFATAGVLANAGLAATASVRAVNLSQADTLLISAAAGGVGLIAAQLALRTGATVVGTASRPNHAFLKDLGVIPLEYGDGLRERLEAAVPGALTAALDYHDSTTVDLALELGVPSSRINSLTAHDYRGVSDIGSAGATVHDLAELADLVGRREIVVPVSGSYRFDEVREAYRRLEDGHVRGKLVVDLTAG